MTLYDKIAPFYDPWFAAARTSGSGVSLEKLITAVRRKGGHGLCRIGRRLDGRFGVDLARLGDFGQVFPSKGILHGSRGVALAPLAADQKWTWSLQADSALDD